MAEFEELVRAQARPLLRAVDDELHALAAWLGLDGVTTP